MFGGVLGLLNRLGGLLLRWIIGESALKDTPRAKQVRVNTAAMLIGAIVGSLVSLIRGPEWYGAILLDLIIGLLIGLIIAYCLDWINDQFS